MKSYSLNYSEDPYITVVWVHCWRQGFDAQLVDVFPAPSLQASFTDERLCPFFPTPEFVPAWFRLSIGKSLTKPFSYDYKQRPCPSALAVPGGGEWACRFCLSNEITSDSGPVHQKTQRDQWWTAGLQWVCCTGYGCFTEQGTKNILCYKNSCNIICFILIVICTKEYCV